MKVDAYRVIELWHGEIGDYKDRLLAAATASPFHTDFELRYGTREVVIRATSAPSDEIAALIAAAPPSLRVTWQLAPYTQRELIGEAQRLMAAQPRLTSAGPLSGGRGLQVTTTDTGLLRATDPQASLGTRYPITVDHQEPTTPI